MKNPLFILSVMFTVFLFSCTNNQGTETHNTEETADTLVEVRKLKLSEAHIGNEFPEAKLTLIKNFPTKAKNLFSFEYKVENYELKSQTEDAMDKHCANSAEGQHIHFILNNSPYKAKYESNFTEELQEGENVILSFLSRSYHESIKNNTAYNLTVINVGNVEPKFNINGQHLFYSRPKGSYKGEDGKKILVDFYLVNTQLSGNGNKVLLTVDDTEEFTISEWKPYFLEGLEPGEHTFRIQLIDSNNVLVEGMFNDSGNRVITIEP